MHMRLWVPDRFTISEPHSRQDWVTLDAKPQISN
jgi:hypothetical protein